MNKVTLVCGLVSAVGVGLVLGGPVGIVVGCVTAVGAVIGYVLSDIADGMAELDETK